MLVGRDSERARLEVLVDGLRDERSFALVVHGDAGIGKTTLVETAADAAQAGGVRVLRLRAYEGEADLAWAGLWGVAGRFIELVDRLPEVQARALRSALALEEAPAEQTAPDRFTVPVALLGLLAAAAAQGGPLLIVIDDAQWLDRASRDALQFVARRLGREGVGLLLTSRDGEGWDVTAARLPALHLTGLEHDDARTVLGDDISADVAEVLMTWAAGNPLALSELRAMLSDAQRSGEEPLPEELPAGERVERLFARQIADLPADTRWAVGVAAAMHRPRADVLAEALAQLGLSRDEIFRAERAGVVSLEHGAIVFRHPLVRAAAYAALDAPSRRATHRVLASVAPDITLRARHLATAAAGPHEPTAAALEDAALDARGRGAPVEAQRAWQRAAELTPDPATARRRQVEAARDALQAGDTERALQDLAAIADDPASGAAVRSEARRLAGVATMRRGQLRDGIALLEQEAERLAGSDPVAAAQTLLLSTGGRFGTGDMADVVGMARRARALGGHVPKIRALADVVEGEGLMPQGRTVEALALIRAGEPSLDLANDDLTLVAMVGVSLLWTEQRADARTLLEDLIFAGRTTGAISRLVFPLAGRADLERRLGRWHAALADARESVRLGRDAGLYAHMSFGLAQSARVDGPMGRLDAARRDAEEALTLTRPAGGGSLFMQALAALGATELSAREPAAAAEVLREALHHYDAMGWHEPSVAPFHGDLVESLVELGEHEQAANVLAGLEADAALSATTWPKAIAARARGLLAEDVDEAVAHFTGSLELPVEVDEPFERARTELLLGDRLREAGRRDDARGPVRRAIATFDQLGAAPWAQRAREVLAVTRGPGRLETVAPSTAPDLTAQEWRIALLVAQGMTNREVGAAVFLSARTIEHILTAIYKKLGVRSRTELARRIAEEDVPAGLTDR